MNSLPPLIAPFGTQHLPVLSAADISRYARHLRLPQMGFAGQQRLLEARVAVVGVGGLGSPIALYLAAAGVGTLGLIDADTVDLSNLQRQIAHTDADCGTLKVDSATAAIRRLNPQVKVETHAVFLDSSNALKILSDFDLVLDGSDNFETRMLVDSAAASLRMPLIWGAVLGFDGQVSVFWERDDSDSPVEDPWADRPGVIYRDLHPEAPRLPVQNCAEAGVLGALCGQVGSLMAIQAVQLLCGFGSPLMGRVAIVDALTACVDELPVKRRDRAASPIVLSKRRPPCPSSARVAKVETATQTRVGLSRLGAATAPLEVAENVSAESLHALLALRERHEVQFQLVDIREPYEWAQGVISGAILVSLQDLAADPSVLDATSPVILTCAAGVRSANLMDYLAVRRPELLVSHFAAGMHGWPFDTTLPGEIHPSTDSPPTNK